MRCSRHRAVSRFAGRAGNCGLIGWTRRASCFVRHSVTVNRLATRPRRHSIAITAFEAGQALAALIAAEMVVDVVQTDERT